MAAGGAGTAAAGGGSSTGALADGTRGSNAEASPSAGSAPSASAGGHTFAGRGRGGGCWGGEDAWASWDGHGYGAADCNWEGCWAVNGWGAYEEGDAWLADGGPCWSGGGWGAGWWDTSHEPRYMQEAHHTWQPAAPSFSPSEEHTARVHFGKTYQVLAEALEAHPDAFQHVGTFLDLGCAPGGFSARLLEEHPDARGFGVTLPVEAGGFPVLLDHEARLKVQGCNLMELNSSEDLECPGEVDVCLADAQDLGRRTNPSSHEKGGGRGGKGRRLQGGSGIGVSVAEGGGVGAACTVLGIWALTLQELLLGLGRLRAGGTFFFRFGWRGRGQSEEVWYREATVWLLALVSAHFGEVKPFKSEFSHQADSSFYVLASGFHRQAYCDAGLDAKLREAIESVKLCQRASELPGCIKAMEEYATQDMQKKVHELLDSVGRQRAIGLATRHHLEANGRPNPEAAIWISPVPFNLTLQRIRERLQRCGKIVNIKRRAHPVGVGADALVQFSQPAHATVALQAIMEQGALGGNISARRYSDVHPS